MKPCFLLFFMVLFPLTGIWAQSKYCDEIVTLGDTVICRDFSGRKNIPFREHFYLNGTRIFTRWWHREKNGEFEWNQRKSKGAFAKKNGPAYYYYADGKVKHTTTYEHDQLVGPCRSFYPSGSLSVICSGHDKGKMNGIQKYLHENGRLAYKLKWGDGRLLEVLNAQDEQGNSIPYGSFKNGNGIFIMKDKDGDEAHFTYKKGKMIHRKFIKE